MFLLLKNRHQELTRRDKGWPQAMLPSKQSGEDIYQLGTYLHWLKSELNLSVHMLFVP